MSRTMAGFFWISVYLLVVLVPVVLMLVPPVPSGRPFWLELSIALGFVGLTQIAVQFVLIARFKRITGPYGIDTGRSRSSRSSPPSWRIPSSS